MAFFLRPSALVTCAAVVFVLGTLALAAVFADYLAGHRDLPLWLNVCAGVLIPAGLGLGLVALLADARADRRQISGASAGQLATQSANSVRSASTTSAPAARN